MMAIMVVTILSSNPLRKTTLVEMGISCALGFLCSSFLLYINGTSRFFRDDEKTEDNSLESLRNYEYLCLREVAEAECLDEGFPRSVALKQCFIL